MTLAIDRSSSAIIGQVTDENPARTAMSCGAPFLHLIGCVRIFTKDGYVNVDAASVRLEEVR